MYHNERNKHYIYILDNSLDYRKPHQDIYLKAKKNKYYST